MTIALLDADIIAYRSAASGELEDFETVVSRMDYLLETIMTETKATSYKMALSGANNFRKLVYPEYKANRKDQVKPRWLNDAKKYLTEKHNAVTQDDCEADDLLGVWQCATVDGVPEETIICTLDKDLQMIPGRHYSWEISGKNWTKHATLSYITSYEGYYNFYHQLITGDPSDNVKGVQGSGKVAARNALSDVKNEIEMFNIVREMYSSDEEMLLNGQCLWIWRKDQDTWRFPIDTSER